MAPTSFAPTTTLFATSRWRFISTVALGLVTLVLCSSAAVADDARGGFVEGQSGAAFYSNAALSEGFVNNFGYGLRSGYRWGGWGAFGTAEHNMWLLAEIGDQPITSVINFGAGGDVLYFDQRVRTSLALALFSTILDDFGSTGFFIDLRPVGLRFPLERFLVFEVNPLSFIMMAPITEGVPLVRLAYRTTLSLEWSL